MRKAIIPDANPIIRDDIERIATAALPWEQFRNKTVLVTGGAGFLAAYMIKALLTVSRHQTLNTRVVCVARSAKSAEMRLSGCIGAPDFSVFEHDISQPLPQSFQRVDFIVHAASQASPKYYGTDPVGTLLANSTGTMHLLDYAIKSQAERFMFFSSGEVYGVPIDSERLIGETDYGYVDPMEVRSCYAESKRMGETMCCAWAQQYGLHSNVVRPFHTYGPGMALDDGRVFADFVGDVVASRDIVLKSNGLAQRPFCYIADAILGFLTVMLRGEKAQAYNIANPLAEVSMRDLATTIAGLFPERRVGVRFDIPDASNAYLKSTIERACPDIAKVSALGWKPEIGIEKGFHRTIQSYLA